MPCPQYIFDFTASATITEGTLRIGKYAALPNFVNGEDNFQLVPINVVDNNDGTFDITEDTSGVRSIIKIAQSKIVDPTSEFGTISGMTEMQVSYTPSLLMVLKRILMLSMYTQVHWAQRLQLLLFYLRNIRQRVELLQLHIIKMVVFQLIWKLKSMTVQMP